MPLAILSQPSTDMGMMACYAAAGWHDVMIDLEHSPHAETDIVAAMAALRQAGGTLHLKMAGLDPEACLRYLHFGVRNFVLPHVESAASVRAVNDALARYPWVDDGAIRLFPLVESRSAIDSIPEICAEKGVGAVQIGLVDLAIDLGLPMRDFHDLAGLGRELMPTILDALDRIRESGKPNGCMLLPDWFDFFPLDRVDHLVVPLSGLLARSFSFPRTPY